MADLLVIADDLTGACDTGVKFAEAGLLTEILVHPNVDLESVDPSVQVIVADTESRHVAPAEAAARVEHVAAEGIRAGARHFYKKTDSTLRGNVGAELDALMRAADAQFLAFAPAFPEAGRATIGGCQHVDGVPIHESAFAADPLAPVTSSSVAEIIARQCARLVTIVAPGEPLPDTGIAVFDAETDADLTRIAQRLAREGRLQFTAGSGGFAGPVARSLGLARARIAGISARGPMLILSGSLQEVALRQVRHAIGAGVAARRVTMACDVGDVAESAGGLLWDGRDVLLYTAGESAHVQAGASQALSRKIGAIAERIIRRPGGTGSVAVFGGETAAATLAALGASRIWPHRELWPGVVEASLRLGDRDVGLITKSGGFGPEDIVTRLIERTNREER